MQGGQRACAPAHPFMNFPRLLRSSFLSMAVLAGAATASATVVYSENFDATNFRSGSLLPNNFSERWAQTDYYFINSFAGWTFTGSAYLAKEHATANQAVLLNETTGVARYTANLAANTLYQLQFNLSGDNIRNQPYRFLLDIGSSNVIDLTQSWSVANPAGYAQSVFFNSGSNGVVNFKFYQASASGASAIFDDVVISTVNVPDEASLAACLGLGLAALFAGRRRRA